MARILITTFGTSGDLNPLIALGLGLRARGYDVIFAVEDTFQRVLTAAGFKTAHHLSGNVNTLVQRYTPEMYRSALPFTSTEIIIERYVVPTLPAKIEELRTASAGVDLMVAPSQHFAASAVSELTGVPLATVNLSPVSFPSAHLVPHPLPVTLPGPLRRLVNRAQWSVGEMVLRSIADTPINSIRAGYGLPARRDQLTTGNLSSRFTAIAVSPAFVRPQPDWPPQVRITGFCFWDTPNGWSEPPELTTFLDGSKPVIAVSAGSTSIHALGVLERFYRTSIEAIQCLGGRALVIGAPPGSLLYPLAEDVLSLPFAPFSEIYPRCSAVIHHGGIGTTAQALRAGVPAVVVPWAFDQFFTAAQVEHIGAGSWLWHRAYSRDRVARTLQGLLMSGSSPAERVRAIAARIAQEDGVASLCDALESRYEHALSHTGASDGQ